MNDLHHPTIENGSKVERADAAVANALLPSEGRLPVQALGALSDLSDQEPLYAAGAAIVGTGLVMRDQRTIRAGTRLLAAHLLATAMRGMVKRLVDRTRPVVAAEQGEYELTEGERFESDYNSFPSGHTAGAVAAARALGRHYPGSRHAWLGLAAAASATQVLRSRHYVTDVVAGAAIGLLAEEAIHRLLCRAERI